MTSQKSVKMFKWIVAFIAIIPLLTGVADMFKGVASQLALGMPNSTAITDPALNSAFRFFAALWIGVGLFFLLFISDLKRYHTALMLLFAVIVIGGIARIGTVIQFGFPEAGMGLAMVIIAISIEIVIVPLLMWWLTRLKLGL